MNALPVKMRCAKVVHNICLPYRGCSGRSIGRTTVRPYDILTCICNGTRSV
jgi:hypothetical protein